MAQEWPLDDTSADARDALTRVYARMSSAEKVERMRAVTLAANRLTLAGLRTRNPEASDGVLLLELAKLRLGEELVRRIYGDG
jgi:hypothetical protein